jgi:cytochrome c oxidase subunit II
MALPCSPLPRIPPCVVLAALTVALPLTAFAAGPATGAGSQDAFTAAGPQAGHILDLWRLTLSICSIVFAAVLIAFLYAIRHAPRARESVPADVSTLHRDERGPRRSVLAATVVSTILLLVLIVASVLTDRAIAALALRDALHIELTAHQWWWEARYDDPQPSRLFSTANELHIPVGRPVILTLRSDDVIHSFWVPNLAGKRDLIPGRSTTLPLRADQAGVYRGQCAEFCGFQHAHMGLVLVAHPAEDFDAWYKSQLAPASQPSGKEAQAGQGAFLSSSCSLCHTIRGTPAGGKVGPDLTHVASRRGVAAHTLPMTRGALAAWIADPQAVKPGAHMPRTELTPDQLNGILAYLEQLE